MHGNTSSRCSSCEENFYNKESLHIYVQECHMLFTCKSCGENYLIEDDLDFHNQKVHTVRQEAPHAALDEVSEDLGGFIIKEKCLEVSIDEEVILLDMLLRASEETPDLEELSIEDLDKAIAQMEVIE